MSEKTFRVSLVSEDSTDVFYKYRGEHRIVSVGKLEDYPSSAWTPRDHVRFDEEIRHGDKPNVVPATQVGELKGFRLHEPRVEGGARSKGIDEWLDRHGIGRRRR